MYYILWNFIPIHLNKNPVEGILQNIATYTFPKWTTLFGRTHRLLETINLYIVAHRICRETTIYNHVEVAYEKHAGYWRNIITLYMFTQSLMSILICIREHRDAYVKLPCRVKHMLQLENGKYMVMIRCPRELPFIWPHADSPMGLIWRKILPASCNLKCYSCATCC